MVSVAAEAQDVMRSAREKLLRKRCDFLVANDVSQPGIGFDAAENEVVLVFEDREIALAKDTKERLALRIIEQASGFPAS